MSDIEIPAWPLVLGAAIAWFAYRTFRPRSATSTSQAAPAIINPALVNIRDVRSIQSMFPDVSEDAIRLALSRPHTTVDRVIDMLLSGVVLPEPVRPASTNKSLIEQYGLKDQVDQSQVSEKTTPVWSDDAKQRQEMLKKRKQDMIIKARQRWIQQSSQS